MEKKMVFGILSIISFVSILFTLEGSSSWIYLLILGIIFVIGWYKFK